ncbi:MAG TPA: hypothetical protein VED59_08725, partial [Acidimicrobiales bacterium]|nr:hypothetical protein [Acidimicrobiales bacterium]
MLEALRVAESDPQRALALAQQVDDQVPLSGFGVGLRGRAASARGRAYRQLGLHMQAGAALRAAVVLLARSGDRVALARASVSLAMERIDSGCFDEAVALLDSAIRDLTGGPAARARAQRALALQRAGRVIDAEEDWDLAIEAFESAGMDLEVAMAKQNRGLVHAYRGELGAADEDLAAAAGSFRRLGEQIRLVEVLHDRGFVAARRGDLPQALALFDSAQSRAAELGVLRPEMLVDRVEVTLQAGLAGEGRALAEAAVVALGEAGLVADVPEACLLAARACEQDDDPAAALAWARRAVSLFGAQHRPRWRLLARYTVLRVEAAREAPPSGIASRLVNIAERLRRAGWATEAVEADLRAAEAFTRSDRLAEASAVLGRLLPSASRMPPLGRLEARLCQSRLCWAAGDPDRAERALLAGLRALLAYQATLGSVELRAAGGGRAEQVMAAGIAMAATSGLPARALWWMEAVRAGQHPWLDRGGEDPEMAASLASLREVTDRLARETPGQTGTAQLRKRQAALEEVIRRRSRSASRLGASSRAIPKAETLAEALGHRLLVEYAAVDQRLVAVVLDRGQCRLADLGELPEVRQAVAGLRLALETALGSGAPPDAAAVLAEAGRRAQDLLLSPLGLQAGCDVVLVADGPVASVPWALLPSLAGSAVVVVSSASAVLHAEAASAQQGGQAGVLVVV